jgi:hypothetical protein
MDRTCWYYVIAKGAGSDMWYGEKTSIEYQRAVYEEKNISQRIQSTLISFDTRAVHESTSVAVQYRRYPKLRCLPTPS